MGRGDLLLTEYASLGLFTHFLEPTAPNLTRNSKRIVLENELVRIFFKSETNDYSETYAGIHHWFAALERGELLLTEYASLGLFTYFL